MIPDEIIEFMSRPVMGGTASRDAQFQPCAIRFVGVKVHSNKVTVTFHITERYSEQIIENFENNGRVSLVIVRLMTNESYQLKGKFVSWRRNNEQDDQFQAEYRDQLIEEIVEGMKFMGYTTEMVASMNVLVCKPGLAITFDVETVFGQTPLPGTGGLIS